MNKPVSSPSNKSSLSDQKKPFVEILTMGSGGYSPAMKMHFQKNGVVFSAKESK